MNAHGELPIGGRTPMGMETPIVKIGTGGNSMRNPGMSSYYGGGGTSPGFQTPNYWPSHREFSEHNRYDEVPGTSPLPRTPILINPSNTPLLGAGLGGGLSTMSPLYTPIGMSGSASFHNNSVHQRPSSNIRSPSYLYQGSGSSSPNYSSLHSHSPGYNSPMGSSGRYGNSPNYSPSPMDPNRMFKEEDNDSEEDDE